MTVLLVSVAAMAADTTEPFDPGASDVELTVGMEPDTVWGDMLFGVGLTPRLSAYAGSTLAGSAALTQGGVATYLGLYGTPVDTDHIDVDLFLDFSSEGRGLTITPALELNLDLAPDLERAGLYTRLRAPMYGCVSAEDAPRRCVDIAWTPGGYLSLGPGQQVLLEAELGLTQIQGPGFKTMALGYNVEVSTGIEMINHVFMGVADRSIGLSTGLITTLP